MSLILMYVQYVFHWSAKLNYLLSLRDFIFITPSFYKRSCATRVIYISLLIRLINYKVAY